MASQFQKLKIPSRVTTVSPATFNLLMDSFNSGVTGIPFTTPIRYSASTMLHARPNGGQQRATRLISEINNVSTVNNNGDSVKLMTALGGYYITVRNSGSKTLSVYPYELDSIDGKAVNEPVSMAPNEIRIFHCISDSEWVSTKTTVDMVTTVPSEYDLGIVEPFAVLTNGTVTISNPNVIIPKGDIGQDTLSPTSGVTFMSGTNKGLSAAAATVANGLYDELVVLTGFTFGATNLEAVNSGHGTGTFVPGVYVGTTGIVTAASQTITLVGDGDYIFISDAALTFGATTEIKLTHGAQAKRVYWVSVGAITTGAVNTLKGNFMTSAAINIGASNDIEGRLVSTLTSAITINGESTKIYTP